MAPARLFVTAVALGLLLSLLSTDASSDANLVKAESSSNIQQSGSSEDASLVNEDTLQYVPQLSEIKTAFFDPSSEGIISRETREQIQSLKPLPGNIDITPEQLLFPHLNYDPAVRGRRERRAIESDGSVTGFATSGDGDDDYGDSAADDGVAVDDPVGGLSGGGSFEFPQKHKRKVLGDSCNNELCKMWQWAVSCKSIGLDLTRECARYLLGYSFDCPDFPRAKLILTAPSVCLQEMVAALQQLASGAVQEYLTTLTDDACDANCYQQYQLRSRNFYLNCYDDLYSTSESAQEAQEKLPLALLNGFFQEFRNQACTHKDDDYCYDGINTVKGALAQVSASAATELGIDDDTVATQVQSVYDFQCNYFHMGSTYDSTIASENLQVLQQTCSLMESLDCCAANGVPLVQQAQRTLLLGGDGSAFLTSILADLFPPCLLRYWQTTPSCDVNLSNFCTDGAIAKLTTMTGSLNIPNVGLPKPSGAQLTFPNMYNKTNVIEMMTAITSALASLGYTGQPYIFNPSYPYQVQITNFVYFNATGGQLTPEDGTPYYPPTGDYVQAASGIFNFQLVLQNLNEGDGDDLYETITGANFQQIMTMIYTGGTAAVEANGVEENSLYAENRDDVSAASIVRANFALSLICMFLSFVGMMVLTSRGVQRPFCDQ